MDDSTNINNFLIIFSHEKYRQILDKIVLDFFGLNANNQVKENQFNSNLPTLEFNVLYKNIFLFNIIVHDLKGFFKCSKKFYLNFSDDKTKRPYELIMPCYWNIYFKYKSPNILKEKKLVQFAQFFAIDNFQELKTLFINLKLFNNNEINDIINMVIIK